MLRNNTSRFAFCFALGLVAACSNNDDPSPKPFVPTGPSEFESGNPQGAGLGAGLVGDRVSGPSAATPDANSENAAGEDGARAIEEADIIKLEGGKLYALSRYGGLSVVDVGRRDRLSLLGRHKVVAIPFEMYVRDGIVIALYQGFGQYSYDDASQQWLYYQTSQVVVLDARKPDAIAELDRFQIPGDISDSRIVGDILYVAAFENGQCWGCDTNRPRTVVMSLDVSSPSAVQKVDEVSREDRQNSWSWQRSLTATDERLYLAGPTWSNSDRPVGSTIEVFDISDPTGDIKDGASVQVTGQIQSRWQMDEYEGVLRVVSQPFQWALTTPPELETFRVTSAADVAPLGSTVIRLPRPEQLQSARFDGTRGYVVTAERTDPLFTIDLGDPAAPRQMGELEMPGWLYHMEPRGDRLLGLGFDQNNPAGAITVSLFDVSDLATPTMLRRVNFGGNWASLAEDQNRIHKAFNVLDSAGLILVPFSGYSYTEKTDGCGIGEYLSGVQLVDFANDDLALRGVAPGKGQARRGFMLEDRLLTMSDERVESFDITDRDAPRTTASLPLAQFVNHAQAAGDKVVRVGQNWWNGTTELDVTTLSGASSPSALGRLEIPQITENACYGGSWLNQVYSSEDSAYFLYSQYRYDAATQKETNTSRVVTVDVSNPSAPAIAADAVLDFVPAHPSYLIGAVSSGDSTVNVGSTFVIANRTFDYTGNTYAVQTSELKVVDLSDPARPEVSTIPLPPTFGATGLVASGNVIATSQYHPLVADHSRVRFYLERVDISNPLAPKAYPSVNVPGSLLAYDHGTARALTVDYRPVVLEDIARDACYAYGSYRFRTADPNVNAQNPIGTCDAIQQTLRLVQLDGALAYVIDSHELEIGKFVGRAAFGDDRVFITLANNGSGYAVGGATADVAGPIGYYGFASGELELLTLSGLGTGELQVGIARIETGNYWYGSGPIVASGHRAALSAGFQGKLTIVDAADVTKPVIARELEIAGYVSDLDVVGNTVVASLGQDGVATVQLAD